MSTELSFGIQPALSQRHLGRIRLSLDWLGQRPAYLWRLLAVGLLTLLSIHSLLQNSVIVDGRQYFWLNDDQMISMRYARNLAQGHGLVWNPGQRIEGYTNFLWTVTMAGLHLLPIGDARMALLVKALNWALACAVLVLGERLLRFFRPHPALALPGLLLMLVFCGDLIYWSVHGFETILLAVIFLFVLARILEESRAARPRLGTYLLMGLLPLVRSDAHYVWLGLALLALGLHHDRFRIARLLAVSLVLPGLHFVFRYGYYGDWLPNAYYLKVAGVPGRLGRGLQHLSRFARNYGVVLVLATTGAGFVGDRRRWLLLGGLLISACYVLVVGGDIFPYSRFLAHLVPVMVVLALVGVAEMTQRRMWMQFLLAWALLLPLLLQDGGYGISILRPERDVVGQKGTVTGVLIGRHTDPQASVAVFAAGGVSYFSHRRAIDLLGKSDPHIARQQARRPDWIGHNKFDAGYSLGLEPDLVAFDIPYEFVLAHRDLETQRDTNYYTALASHPVFKQEYLGNPVHVPYLLQHTAVFVRESSAEMTRRTSWQQPQLVQVLGYP